MVTSHSDDGGDLSDWWELGDAFYKSEKIDPVRAKKWLRDGYESMVMNLWFSWVVVKFVVKFGDLMKKI